MPTSIVSRLIVSTMFPAVNLSLVAGGVAETSAGWTSAKATMRQSLLMLGTPASFARSRWPIWATHRCSSLSFQEKFE